MKAVLVISDRDNVATALVPLRPGDRVEVKGAAIIVRNAIPPGHKIALAAIARGDAVMKYGSPIGIASSDIAEGAHVHTHNLASTRGRGDLAAASGDPAGMRLAEPVDAGLPAATPESKHRSEGSR